MPRVHLTDPSKVGTYDVRTTKGGNWQVYMWLPDGFVIRATCGQGSEAERFARHVAQLLNGTQKMVRGALS